MTASRPAANDALNHAPETPTISDPASDDVRDLILNGAPIRSAARTLADVVAAFSVGDARVATAVNEAFVAASDRASTKLEDGDRIEIVTARQGG